MEETKIECDDCQMTEAFIAELSRLLKESKDGSVNVYWHGVLVGTIINP